MSLQTFLHKKLIHELCKNLKMIFWESTVVITWHLKSNLLTDVAKYSSHFWLFATYLSSWKSKLQFPSFQALEFLSYQVSVPMLLSKL